MTFDRKSLLGLHPPVRATISDIRRSAGEEARAQQKSANRLQSDTGAADNTMWHLSAEQLAEIKMQIVEKHGRRLWEEKQNQSYLEEIAGEIRLLLEMRTTLTSHQLDVEGKRLLHELIGWGPLDGLLEDQDISEILIHRYDYVVVERKSTGRIERLQQQLFRDEEQLLRLIEHIAATMGREFNESKAEMHTQLPDGSRIAAVHRSISPDGHMLTVRKHRHLLTEAEYLQLGSICEPVLQFLKWSVGLARASGIVSGGTGSGKTHLLNLLSHFIPEHLSVITIEDVLEMQFQHPYVRRFLSKPANYEGKGGFSIRDCVRLSLRKRPDVIVVGETRGAEIVDILWAMNTDHPGSWSTAHANSPRALIDSTLPILFAKADEHYNSDERNLMIGSALDLIVQVKRFEEDGSRKVVAVTEVIGTGGAHDEQIRRAGSVKQIVPNRVYLQDIYVFQPTGLVGGKVVGEYRWTGYKPERMIRKWLAKGLTREEADQVFFSTPVRV
ncbi:Flp pilus assembly complex ATPase component TadA [Brevibacillus humidisoli]|uniref:CpaF family protein n=1 Tax=Brevibacillus humidisoli TaxID=2895522 RepID=UPI001E3064C9|nr:ATPase, T2SS/T4P/T4SS family [Brevibacillus humidisoli]UFJ40578.1 Flp pilus assembly complex ATPase component TadA [Brevibacillus humidisoli]